MKIAVLKLKLYAPWVHSLKEKRMIVKSLLAKLRNKFQVSAAEVEDQDIHQSIVIGVAAIVPHSARAEVCGIHRKNRPDSEKPPVCASFRGCRYCR